MCDTVTRVTVTPKLENDFFFLFPRTPTSPSNYYCYGKSSIGMADVWIDQGTRNDGDRFATTVVCGCACKMPTGASGSR